ncbi:MAG: hypothetical protein ABEN55_21835 [Bradymonadaceae bacterium]
MAGFALTGVQVAIQPRAAFLCGITNGSDPDSFALTSVIFTILAVAANFRVATSAFGGDTRLTGPASTHSLAGSHAAAVQLIGRVLAYEIVATVPSFGHVSFEAGARRLVEGRSVEFRTDLAPLRVARRLVVLVAQRGDPVETSGGQIPVVRSPVVCDERFEEGEIEVIFELIDTFLDVRDAQGFGKRQ